MYDRYTPVSGSPVSERRLSPRRVTTLPARFRLHCGQAWLPCVIRDIGATGVGLQLPDFPVLSDRILLSIEGVAMPVDCRLVWTSNGIAGFRFAGAGC